MIFILVFINCCLLPNVNNDKNDDIIDSYIPGFYEADQLLINLRLNKDNITSYLIENNVNQSIDGIDNNFQSDYEKFDDDVMIIDEVINVDDVNMENNYLDSIIETYESIDLSRLYSFLFEEKEQNLSETTKKTDYSEYNIINDGKPDFNINNVNNNNRLKINNSKEIDQKKEISNKSLNAKQAFEILIEKEIKSNNDFLDNNKGRNNNPMSTKIFETSEKFQNYINSQSEAYEKISEEIRSYYKCQLCKEKYNFSFINSFDDFKSKMLRLFTKNTPTNLDFLLNKDSLAFKDELKFLIFVIHRISPFLWYFMNKFNSKNEKVKVITWSNVSVNFEEHEIDIISFYCILYFDLKVVLEKLQFIFDKLKFQEMIKNESLENLYIFCRNNIKLKIYLEKVEKILDSIILFCEQSEKIKKSFLTKIEIKLIQHKWLCERKKNTYRDIYFNFFFIIDFLSEKKDVGGYSLIEHYKFIKDSDKQMLDKNRVQKNFCDDKETGKTFLKFLREKKYIRSHFNREIMSYTKFLFSALELDYNNFIPYFGAYNDSEKNEYNIYFSDEFRYVLLRHLPSPSNLLFVYWDDYKKTL